jgi:hypothetical protein
MQFSGQASFISATWEPYATTRVWTLGSNNTVYARFKDNAGNISQSYCVSLDSTCTQRIYLPLVVR